VTVIVLSIEQEPATYDAIMRAAFDLELVSNSTAFVSLNFDEYRVFPDYFEWKTHDPLWDLLLGIIVTQEDIACIISKIKISL
jgi:hypothetical protein